MCVLCVCVYVCMGVCVCVCIYYNIMCVCYNIMCVCVYYVCMCGVCVALYTFSFTVVFWQHTYEFGNNYWKEKFATAIIIMGKMKSFTVEAKSKRQKGKNQS